MSERIVVQSFDGLYDERSEAVLMHISHRKFCIRHDFINASLMWENRKGDEDGYFSINIENRANEPGFCFQWGIGYGGIRYCKRCKLIDCIHVWDEAKAVTYVIESGPFYEERQVVQTCRACGRRILTGGCGACKPSTDAQRIIREEYTKLRGGEFNEEGFGSGWVLEFPVHISNVLAQQGEEAARSEARVAFVTGDIHHLMGRWG